jgi:hypothetical protein
MQPVTTHLVPLAASRRRSQAKPHAFILLLFYYYCTFSDFPATFFAYRWHCRRSSLSPRILHPQLCCVCAPLQPTERVVGELGV